MWQFLSAFATLRKATISFVMSVRLSGENNSVGNARIFIKPDIRLFFKNCRKNSVFIQTFKNAVYCTWRPVYIFVNISLSCSQNEDFSNKRCRENQNTHFMFNNFSQKSCRLYNILQPNRPQITSQCCECTLYARYLRLQTHTQNM